MYMRTVMGRSSTELETPVMQTTTPAVLAPYPIRVEGHAPRLDFPPALDADGEKLRREFGLPGRRKT